MKKLRTQRMVGLFLAAALTVSGCSSAEGLDDDECYDDDGNGYCDDNGDNVSGYHYLNGKKVFYRSGFTGGGIDVDGTKKFTSGIAKGSKSTVSGSKGGIGSSSGSGG
jgi:hypothetical protein